MINFNLKNYQGYGGANKRYQADLIAFTQTIEKELSERKNNNFWLGVHLIEFYDSNAYSILECDKEQLRLQGLNVPCGFGNCCSAYFFHYCFERFGMDKTQVSRLMNIVDEFGDEFRGFKKCWEKFSYSQLCELLPLSAEQRKLVKPEWSIRRIREYKKSLVATSQQTEIEIPNTEQPPSSIYDRFEKWKRVELCDKIIELEEERDNLIKEIDLLRRSLNGEFECLKAG